MRYYFIALIMAMSKTIQATPQLTAAGINALSIAPPKSACMNEDENNRSTAITQPPEKSSWPSCTDIMECLMCCCHATYVIAKIALTESSKGPFEHRRKELYQKTQEQYDRR